MCLFNTSEVTKDSDKTLAHKGICQLKIQYESHQGYFFHPQVACLPGRLSKNVTD
jgi:hypothetical protein